MSSTVTAELSPETLALGSVVYGFFIKLPTELVVLRACDFFDLFVFSAYSTSCIQAPRQIVILSGAPHRLNRVTQRLWRGVEEPVLSVAEGTSKVLNYPCCSFGCFSSKLPQNRHPERSAARIYRVTQRLWRAVEEPVLSVAEGTSAALN